MHFSNLNIKFTFCLSTRFSAHEHRFLSKFNYLDFISVKYENQLRMALSEFADEICKSVGWNLSDGRNVLEHSNLTNPSNSAF